MAEDDRIDFAQATGMPFPEGFKKDAQVPLWWRRIHAPVFESDKRSYVQSGLFPASRQDVEEEIRELLEGEFNTPLYIGRHHKPALMDVLTAINRKMSFIMKLVLADVPVLTPTQVKISPRGLSFWDAQSTLKIHDLLEMQIPLFSGYPLLIRCFARVALLQPDVRRGMVQVVCRYESPGGTLTAEVATEPPRLTLPPERPPAVTPAPAPVIVTPTLQPTEPPKERETHESFSAGRRAQNRRQSFRINGVIPLAWRLVDVDEFQPIYDAYKVDRKLIERDVTFRYQELIIALDFHLARLAEHNAKVIKPMQYLRQQLDLFCRRSNTPKEEQFYLSMLEQLQIMVEELVPMEISQRLSNLVLSVKFKMEIQLDRDRIDFRTDPKKKQEIPLQLKKVSREIEKALSESLEVTQRFMTALVRFLELLNTMDTTADDLAAEGDDPNGTLISRPINISVTGMAFRTKKQVIQKGDIVEFHMGLVPEGEVQIPRDRKICYGSVVMIKDMDLEKQIRIATEFIILPVRLQEEVFALINRLQRERLSNRIEVDEY